MRIFLSISDSPVLKILSIEFNRQAQNQNIGDENQDIENQDPE